MFTQPAQYEATMVGKMKKKGIPAILFLLFVSNCFATRIRLSCFSNNDNGNPYQYIIIKIAGKKFIKTLSNHGNGLYEIANIISGVYTIIIESNSGTTALESLLITNVEINSQDTIIYRKIYISQIGGCADYVIDASPGQKDTTYYTSGKIKGTGGFIITSNEGKKLKLQNGKWTFYYENGDLKSIISFRNGVPHYIKSFLDSSNKIVREGGYINGCKSGKWIYYKEGQEYITLRFYPFSSSISIDFIYLEKLATSYKDVFE